MYLKAIEIENFKSFVGKTKISFKEGFTAISGPNGSGKSNIGDAILFVLGPKSSKVIRAQRLTDLIYDGGKDGKPANYCRVSLIFDNSDRVLPIDEGEVKLTRYVRRANNDEGYNSYFYINDEKARLQDFISLLNHARIDADGYNFVKQGDITKIVEMTALERRVILDDIAGITKFNDEIKKAEEKKKITEGNMEKIGVIIEEIKNRLNVLEKDREVALKYKELEEKLKETYAKIAYSKMIKARSDMDSYTRQVESIEKEINELDEKIKKYQEEIEKIKKDKEEVDKKIEDMGGGDIKKMSDDIDSLKIEIAKIKTNIENREDRIRENEERIKELKIKMKLLRNEIKNKEKEIRERDKKLKDMVKNYEEKKSELENKERKIGEDNKRFRKLQKKLFEITDKINGKREEHRGKVVEENKIKDKINSILKEIAEAEEEKKNVEMAIKDAQWRISQFMNDKKDVDKKRKKLNEEYYQLKNEDSKLRKEEEDKRKEMGNLEREYEKLRGRIEGKDPMSMAVMAIMEARDRGMLDGIYGTIADLGEVDEKYELAIEVAAGNRMMAIVCRDDVSAARAIEYLKKNKMGRAIFLPLNKMLRGRPRGKAILASRDPHSFGFAIDLIKFDKKFEQAFWYVFGDTVVVDNLDNARKLMGGVRLVTLDGQLIEASGAMIGGNVERMKKISMGNVEKIGEKLRIVREEINDIELRRKEIEKRIDEIMDKIRELNTNTNEAQIEVWKKERDKNEKALGEILKKIKDLNAEKSHYEKILNNILDEEKIILEDIEELSTEEKRIRDTLDSLVPEKIAEEIKSLKDEVSSLRERIGKEKEELINLKNSLESLRKDEESILNEIKKLENSNEEFVKENKEASKKLENMEIEKKKLEEIIKEEEKKLKSLMDEREKLGEKIISIDKEIERKKNDIHVKEEMIITLNARIKEFGERYEEFRKEYESYGVEIKEGGSIKKLEKYADEIQSQISSLGPVNMKSIDEYDMEMERHKKLSDDYSKLMKEKKELESLVKELNNKKKDGLFKVFNAINENFKKIFTEISDGGEAELVLENMEDPFKGGLIMKVKPMGRKSRILHSLSGGEKSLAALAFIFAIQQYEPSPIYLLDEVDMFLDGVNAEIVGRIIKRNSQTAQFIVISLRKATIKFADHVIGVTHRGDGISRVFMETVPVEVSENA